MSVQGVQSMVKQAVREGVHAVPTWSGRASLVQKQHSLFMQDVARQAAEHGLDNADVLGAHAMLGVRSLDGLPSNSINDAVQAAREVKRDVVYVIGNGPQNPKGSIENLARELRVRGAEAHVLDAARIDTVDGALIYRGVDGAVDTPLAMPDAVTARGVATRVMRPFEEAGVHMGNLASTRPITLSKNLQAGLFESAGVAHPRTIPDLSSAAEVREAAQLTGFPTVVKLSNGAGGKGVWIPKNEAELEQVIATHLKNPKPKSLLVQQYMDVGAADDRVTVARNVHGKLDVVSVHHRQGAGTDGLANGPQGSLYTRVPMDKVDDETRRVALAATDAVGLDYAGIDVVTTSSGRKFVLEANGTPGIPEHDVPLPRDEHSLPALADWLVYGGKRA